MSPAETFRAAVHTGDYARALSALDGYLAPARAGSATLEEVANARDTVLTALAAVTAHREHLASELARATNLRRGYHDLPLATTWRLDG